MKKSILFFASFAVALAIAAQSPRENIAQQIKASEECTSVALTEANGNAIIHRRNEWYAEGCPNAFTEALYDLQVRDVELQDIHLTELDRWLVLYDENKIASDLLYENLKQKIANCQEDGEKITTVTFNDNGYWVIITTKQISASNDDLMDWIKDGCEQYGQIWTACITNNAAIAVYESGFKYFGNIPEDLKEALRTCESDIYTVKVAGDAWLFRCTNGYSRYHL